jgi:hypothetical protein
VYRDRCGFIHVTNGVQVPKPAVRIVPRPEDCNSHEREDSEHDRDHGDHTPSAG